MDKFVYEEVPYWRVPVVKRVAADVMREAVQDDLGVSFEVKWLRELTGFEREFHNYVSRLTRIAEQPMLKMSEYRRFEKDEPILGFTRTVPHVVWVNVDQTPHEVARVVAHEAKHRQQHVDGSFPVWKFEVTPEIRWAAERDAEAYEAKAAAWVPTRGSDFAGLLEFKASDLKSVGDDGTFTGYASTFGNEDLQGDVVMPGAFKATLAEDGRKRPLLFMHEVGREIGLVSGLEDDYGLWVSGALYVSRDGDPSKSIEDARDALVRMRRRRAAGMPQQMSIGFRARKAERSGGVRELHDIALYEVSLVTFAANPMATVSA